MLSKLQRRMAREEGGFTLIELLVVIIIIGILLAIAVPSYLSFKQRANATAAQANIRSAVPAIEAYNADNGTYVSMDYVDGSGVHALAVYDEVVAAAFTSTPAKLVFGTITATSYCLQSTVGSETYYKATPTAEIVEGACP